MPFILSPKPGLCPPPDASSPPVGVPLPPPTLLVADRAAPMLDAEEDEAAAEGDDAAAAPLLSCTRSLSLKMCTVPLSDVEASMLALALKAMDTMSALSVPRRSSCSSSPVKVSYTLQN